jgi:hypothetical protein
MTKLVEAEVAHVAEAEQLAFLVEDISKALKDLGVPPIQGIPLDLVMMTSLR